MGFSFLHQLERSGSELLFCCLLIDLAFSLFFFWLDLAEGTWNGNSLVIWNHAHETTLCVHVSSLVYSGILYLWMHLACVNLVACCEYQPWFQRRFHVPASSTTRSRLTYFFGCTPAFKMTLDRLWYMFCFCVNKTNWLLHSRRFQLFSSEQQRRPCLKTVTGTNAPFRWNLCVSRFS